MHLSYLLDLFTSPAKRQNECASTEKKGSKSNGGQACEFLVETITLGLSGTLCNLCSSCWADILAHTVKYLSVFHDFNIRNFIFLGFRGVQNNEGGPNWLFIWRFAPEK
jgi:hypothetical protein